MQYLEGEHGSLNGHYHLVDDLVEVFEAKQY